MTLSGPDALFGARLEAHDSDDEADDERMQIDVAVESTGEGGEIVASALAVVECVVCTCQGRHRIAQDGPDPSEFVQIVCPD